MYARSREIAKSAGKSALTHIGSTLRDHLVKRSQERIEERSALSGGRRYHVGKGGSIPRYSCGRKIDEILGVRYPDHSNGCARFRKLGMVRWYRVKGGDEGDLPLSRVSRAACMTFLRRRPSPGRVLVIVLVKVAPVLSVLTSSPFAHSSVADVVVAAVVARR